MANGEVFITRRARFSAAHKLWRPEWSEEKNLEVFGKCSNPNWHGHNYEMHVTVKGVPDNKTGFVADLSEINVILQEEVIKHVDHKNLNLDVDFLEGLMASTENLAVAFWKRLENPVKQLGAQLYSIKLQETENNYVTYYG